MIDMKLYKKLAGKWAGKIYQRYDKERFRFDHFSKVVHEFKGRNVLEIGTNAGVQSLEITSVASSWAGIEINPEYYEQLKQTLVHAKCPVWHENMALERFCVDGFNGAYDSLYTSFVIYHLSDAEVKLLAAKILPNVNFWMVYNRTHRPTVKNSYGFEHPENTLAFMEAAGFKVKWMWGPKKIWSFFIGRKPC